MAKEKSEKPVEGTENWVCTYCNERNNSPTTPEHGVGRSNCKRCGTKRSR